MSDRNAARAALAEDSNGDAVDSPFTHDPHVYDGERCINCDVNVYDDALYGPYDCISRASIHYTTESDGRS